VEQIFNNGNGNTTDKFHYVYKTLTGDVTIIAKISSLIATDGKRTGIMFRSSTADNAQYFELIQDGNGNVGLIKRSSDGGAGGLIGFAATPVNATWIKIIKMGNSFAAAYSSDSNPEVNNAWNYNFTNYGNTQTSPVMMIFGSSFLMGFVVYDNGGSTSQATLNNITINGQSF
jgi:hypothetical protein